MPYDTLDDLPKSVKNNLPKHAQKIYLEAFNRAWEDYKNPEDRRGNASREEIAYRVAWTAVKKKYEKKDDKWVRKDD